MAKATELTIPCPGCGTTRFIAQAEWSATMSDRPVWNKKQQQYISMPGPDSGIECYTCNDHYPAHQWHRAFERAEFARKGWKTPAMEAMT
jgi:hypothetical protein